MWHNERTHQKKKILNDTFVANIPKEYKILDIFHNLRKLGELFTDAKGFYSHYNLGAGKYGYEVFSIQYRYADKDLVCEKFVGFAGLESCLCLKIIPLDNNVHMPHQLFHTIHNDDDCDDY